MCISSSWLLPKWRFLAKDLHLQCVLGNPRTGGVRSCSWYCRKELVLEVEGSMNPVILWLKAQAMTKAVEGFVKSVPLVWGLVVWLLVVPGESRVSVGVDCFVPCPPSVAPRTLNPTNPKP